jgi:hypothetical protein
MNTVNCTLNVTLEIEGPFLCGSASPALWGLDTVFMRDYMGNAAIPKKHIKGKLKEALIEIQEFTDKEIDSLFGQEGRGYELSRGRLDFSNFTQPGESGRDILPHDIIHRIKMESKRGVVDENMLVALENLFPSGKSYKWEGEINYTAKDKDEAEAIAGKLKIGLRWISAFGAEKGIGFGRLKNVSIDVTTADISFSHAEEVAGVSEISLKINALEPLLILNEIKATNYLESGDIIPGNMLKGAFAEALNRNLNPEGPFTTPIDNTNVTVNNVFPSIAKYFSSIRFTHAYPSVDDKRPVVVPLTAVKSKAGYSDIAFTKPEEVTGDAPFFKGDWKGGGGPAGFGWAEPSRFVSTSTAIDPALRRALDGNLYTCRYVCPVDKDGNDIFWIADVSIDTEMISDKDKGALAAELLTAISWIDRIGKERGRVKLTALADGSTMAHEMASLINDEGYAIVTLQSDALMLNPDDMLNADGEQLKKLYKAFWEKDGLFEMEDFFAEQKLAGGTRVMRHKQSQADSYYPFFLTSAGSVFVLKLKGERENAEKFISKALKEGLPLPGWVENKYRANGKELWQACPFIPQNGYSEIAVNLKWHSDNAYKDKGGAE